MCQGVELSSLNQGGNKGGDGDNDFSYDNGEKDGGPRSSPCEEVKQNR